MSTNSGQTACQMLRVATAEAKDLLLSQKQVPGGASYGNLLSRLEGDKGHKLAMLVANDATLWYGCAVPKVASELMSVVTKDECYSGPLAVPDLVCTRPPYSIYLDMCFAHVHPSVAQPLVDAAPQSLFNNMASFPGRGYSTYLVSKHTQKGANSQAYGISDRGHFKVSYMANSFFGKTPELNKAHPETVGLYSRDLIGNGNRPKMAVNHTLPYAKPQYYPFYKDLHAMIYHVCVQADYRVHSSNVPDRWQITNGWKGGMDESEMIAAGYGGEDGALDWLHDGEYASTLTMLSNSSNSMNQKIAALNELQRKRDKFRSEGFDARILVRKKIIYDWSSPRIDFEFVLYVSSGTVPDAITQATSHATQRFGDLWPYVGQDAVQGVLNDDWKRGTGLVKSQALMTGSDDSVADDVIDGMREVLRLRSASGTTKDLENYSQQVYRVFRRTALCYIPWANVQNKGKLTDWTFTENMANVGTRNKIVMLPWVEPEKPDEPDYRDQYDPWD